MFFLDADERQGAVHLNRDRDIQGRRGDEEKLLSQKRKKCMGIMTRNVEGYYQFSSWMNSLLLTAPLLYNILIARLWVFSNVHEFHQPSYALSTDMTSMFGTPGNYSRVIADETPEAQFMLTRYAGDYEAFKNLENIASGTFAFYYSGLNPLIAIGIRLLAEAVEHYLNPDIYKDRWLGPSEDTLWGRLNRGFLGRLYRNHYGQIDPSKIAFYLLNFSPLSFQISAASSANTVSHRDLLLSPAENNLFFRQQASLNSTQCATWPSPSVFNNCMLAILELGQMSFRKADDNFSDSLASSVAITLLISLGLCLMQLGVVYFSNVRREINEDDGHSEIETVGELRANKRILELEKERRAKQREERGAQAGIEDGRVGRLIEIFDRQLQELASQGNTSVECLSDEVEVSIQVSNRGLPAHYGEKPMPERINRTWCTIL